MCCDVRNIGWQLRPGISCALTAVGLIIDFCALGPTYIIWGNFYSAEDSEAEHYFFQNTICISLFMLLFTSTLDIIDEIVESSLARGTEEEKEILLLNREFQKLAALLENSSTVEFLEFLVDRDESTKKELLERIDFSADKLDAYVSTFDLEPPL